MEARDLVDGQKNNLPATFGESSFDYQPETTNFLTSRVCGLRSVISEILLLFAYSVYFNS
ncbi:MAG: hypothetical protein HRU77_05895 [Gammaproteobacteria bacterium]|jgi:hypothetical protein|nr:hypothetical protein [Pseudomonadota bacterium]QOJ20267.1 MAG: hypothetical protein HRU77_05895 [Gammaproteobacteria bacterium]